MQLEYISTRGWKEPFTASQAILRGLAPDGGLFVPSVIPKLDIALEKIPALSYQELAYEVMKLLLTDFTPEELKGCIARAYDEKFDIPQITQLKKADEAWYLELFHGATIAFKDMALSLLPHLMTTAAAKNGSKDKIVILTATSGDTGKAALSAFADVPGTGIIVFYPKHGVSAVQERQMVTQKGENTCVIGIEGNFDDAQRGVKQIFSDQTLAGQLKDEGYVFSSANSINIGRLVPQIVYYVYAYGQLLLDRTIQPGDEINVVVPTGNFGNILAAWYAKQMGLPVSKLICASNENRVLTDFFQSGTYDRNREFILTSSPSMDILVSSNLERLIYHIAGNDAGKCSRLMSELSGDGAYTITDDMRERLDDFEAGSATQEETANEIRIVYEKAHYILDTHTAVASRVYRAYRQKTDDEIPAVIASTASPYKFAASVMKSLGETELSDDFALIDRLSEVSGIPLPTAIREILQAPVRHDRVIDAADMKETVSEICLSKSI